MGSAAGRSGPSSEPAPSCIEKRAHQTARDTRFVNADILTMDSRFFERPILNSPYAYPARHWELDAQGQPTGDIIEARRTAQFITPIPRPKKHKRSAGQERLVSATVWTSGAPSASRARGA